MESQLALFQFGPVPIASAPDPFAGWEQASTEKRALICQDACLKVANHYLDRALTSNTLEQVNSDLAQLFAGRVLVLPDWEIEVVGAVARMEGSAALAVSLVTEWLTWPKRCQGWRPLGSISDQDRAYKVQVFDGLFWMLVDGHPYPVKRGSEFWLKCVRRAEVL